MAWLHTWCGLVGGWLLCVIFLTGSLSVFRDPITRWMEAQPVAIHASQARADDAVAVGVAAHYLAEHGAGARMWRIQLPGYPGEAIRLTWRSGSASQEAFLRPDTGTPVPPGAVRKTEGGRHFMSFHYMLQWPVVGFWVVGGLTIGLLVALVSGVIIHRRIFKDFFTFRPGTGPRAWLDAHNVCAVLTLPFLLMIAYTGLSIFATSYVPWPLQQVYGAENDAYDRFAADLANGPAPAWERATATAPQWADLLRQAWHLTGQSAQMLLVTNPGTPDATVRIVGRAHGAVSTSLFTPQASIRFNGATGEVIELQRPDPDTLALGAHIEGVVRALHFADFGGWVMKWVYFACGLLGTLMMAAGTVLFSIKRRIKSQQEFGALTRPVYRAIEALNLACIVGIGVACCGYFYANRLIPAQLPARAEWEIRCFALIWLATLIHALCRPGAKGWNEQLSLAAVLSLGLPLLNYWTTGQDLWHYLAADDWQRASVEGVSLVCGGLLLWVLGKRRYGRKLMAREQSAPSRPEQHTQPFRQLWASRGWDILSRVLAASIGGYAVSSLAMALLALGWSRLDGNPSAVGVLTATMLGFAVHVAVVIGVFSSRSASRAWIMLGLMALLLGTALAGLAMAAMG